MSANWMFEKNIEEALVQYFQENEISARRSRHFQDITTKDVEVFFDYQGSLEETRFPKNGHLEYDAHEGTLSIIVTSNRDFEDTHLERIGNIRKLLQNYLHPLNASEYQILDIRPMAFSTTENEEQNADTTILNFNVKFQVDVLFRQ
jgi:hypothetical protein